MNLKKSIRTTTTSQKKAKKKSKTCKTNLTREMDNAITLKIKTEMALKDILQIIIKAWKPRKRKP